MRPAQIAVTSTNSPVIRQVDYANYTGIVALPAGAGNYDVAFTRTPFNEELTQTWVDITGMSAATTTQDTVVNVITGLRITLNSGTSVTVDITQSSNG